jgi:hypothetical protein
MISVGTAIMGLFGKVAGAVADKNAQDYKNQLDSVKDQNANLLASANAPIWIIGGMVCVGAIVLLLKKKD